ncbi:hypothetical protein B4120_4665 [Bacillus cereus]|nr:hypothetical protein B4120_4665 [Bacillus cereus]
MFVYEVYKQSISKGLDALWKLHSLKKEKRNAFISFSFFILSLAIE